MLNRGWVGATLAVARTAALTRRDAGTVGANIREMKNEE